MGPQPPPPPPNPTHTVWDPTHTHTSIPTLPPPQTKDTSPTTEIGCSYKSIEHIPKLSDNCQLVKQIVKDSGCRVCYISCFYNILLLIKKAYMSKFYIGITAFCTYPGEGPMPSTPEPAIRPSPLLSLPHTVDKRQLFGVPQQPQASLPDERR